MKLLTIELVKGQKRDLQSLGWKVPKENEVRRQFYALDPTGKPLVITPKLAVPEFYDACRRSKAVCAGEIYPDAVCVEISPCRLLPPLCFQSYEELKGEFGASFALEPWKAIYWNTHREVLVLEPSHDGPLQACLDQWLTARRKAYGCRTENHRNEIERLTLTLEDVKRGFEGIRDAWMHGEWAKKNGEDLHLMARERRQLRKWLVGHTGTFVHVYDLTIRQRREEIDPPDFGEGFESTPKFLEACALVRYRARFADKASSVVYLADCEPPREELDAAELDEVAKLRGAPTNVRRQRTRPLDKPNPRARFEKDFSVAVIPELKGELLFFKIEPELQSLLKCIIEAGGNISRTDLREGKSDSFQPEKLLRSRVAKATMRAGLWGRMKRGRTTVFWAKVQAD